MNKRLLLALALCLQTASPAQLSQPHCVNVIVKALPSKEKALKQELIQVRDLSKKEKTCLLYEVIESTDGKQFSLYEKWTSEKDHAKQFEKSYIVDLVAKLPGLIEMPYHCVMGHQVIA